jgi:hypothetical protein
VHASVFCAGLLKAVGALVNLNGQPNSPMLLQMSTVSPSPSAAHSLLQPHLPQKKLPHYPTRFHSLKSTLPPLPLTLPLPLSTIYLLPQISSLAPQRHRQAHQQGMHHRRRLLRRRHLDVAPHRPGPLVGMPSLEECCPHGVCNCKSWLQQGSLAAAPRPGYRRRPIRSTLRCGIHALLPPPSPTIFITVVVATITPSTPRRSCGAWLRHPH